MKQKNLIEEIVLVATCGDWRQGWTTLCWFRGTVINFFEGGRSRPM